MTPRVLRFCKGWEMGPPPIIRAAAHDSVRRTHGVSDPVVFRGMLFWGLGVQCTLLEVANLVEGIIDCTFEKGRKAPLPALPKSLRSCWWRNRSRLQLCPVNLKHRGITGRVVRSLAPLELPPPGLSCNLGGSSCYQIPGTLHTPGKTPEGRVNRCSGPEKGGYCKPTGGSVHRGNVL